MATRTVESEIDYAFVQVLEREGFERLPGELLSYVRTSDDGRSRSHVDVELRDYLGGFGVTLQEVRAGGSTRRQLLEDFQGIEAYRIDRRNAESVKDAIAQALADLHLYGLPWLAGQVVSTAATERVHQLISEGAYQDAVRVAREKFKAGAYAEALRLFGEARVVKPLDALDEKFRAMAEKKVSGG
jgi:hypothetical protein